MTLKEDLKEYLLDNKDETFSIKGLEGKFDKSADIIIKVLGKIEREEQIKIIYC